MQWFVRRRVVDEWEGSAVDGSKKEGKESELVEKAVSSHFQLGSGCDRSWIGLFDRSRGSDDFLHRAHTRFKVLHILRLHHSASLHIAFYHSDDVLGLLALED